jgi:threonine dehydrogenase-like Zn-dependent dehydrogenase
MIPKTYAQWRHCITVECGIPLSADFIAQRGLPIDDLFSHRWSLHDATAAYEEFDRQTAGKGVFVF